MHETARDDDDVAPFEDRAGRRVAHPVDLLVERRFLFDIGVGARDVGLGLVIIVIGDEILDRVLREEALHLAIELRRQRLVRRQDDRRAAGARDDMRHRKGLATAGDPEQHLVAARRVRGRRTARRSPAAGRRPAGTRNRGGTASRYRPAGVPSGGVRRRATAAWQSKNRPTRSRDASQGIQGAEIPWTREIFPGLALSANKPLIYRE